MRIGIKPLSVNKAWKGRRFATNEYKKYTKAVLLILQPVIIPEGNLELSLKFGFSSASSDIDNPVKCFIDCLQKKYGFNDKLIKRLIVDTETVKKGCEFIEWSAKEYEC